MNKRLLAILLMLAVVATSVCGLVGCNKEVPEEFPTITFSGLTELTFYTNQTITQEDLIQGVTAKDDKGVSYTVCTYDTTALKAEEGTYSIVLACRDSENKLVRKDAKEIWKAERSVKMEYPPVQEVDRADWSTSLKLVSVSFPDAAGNVQTGVFSTKGTNLAQPTEEERAKCIVNLSENTSETKNGQKYIYVENWLNDDAVITAGELWYITCENLSNWHILFNNRTKIKADETMIAVQGKGAGWSAIIIKSAEVIRYSDVSGENEEIYTLNIRVPYSGNDMTLTAVFELYNDDSAVPFTNYAENLRLSEEQELIYTSASVTALNTAIDNCLTATTREAYKPLFDIAYQALVDLEKNFDNVAMALMDDMEEGDWSTVTWQAFVDAVQTAASELVDKTEYDRLYQLAVDAKEALNARIDTSSAANLMTGLSQADYTSESWSAFKNAVEAAVAENDNQAEFNRLFAIAQTAKENLVDKPAFDLNVKLKSIKLYGDSDVVTHSGISSSNLVKFMGEGLGELETSYAMLYGFSANTENPLIIDTGLDFSFKKGDVWYLQMLSIGGGYVSGGGDSGTKVAGSADDGSMKTDLIPLQDETTKNKNMLRISYSDLQNYVVTADDEYVMTVYFTAQNKYLYADLTFVIDEPEYTFANSTFSGTLASNEALKSSFLYKYVGEGIGDAETDYQAVVYYNYTQPESGGVKTAAVISNPVFAKGDKFYLQIESLGSGFNYLDADGNVGDAPTMLPQLSVPVYSGDTFAKATKNCCEITYDDLVNKGILNQDGTVLTLKIRVVYSGLNDDMDLNFTVA